MIARLAFSIWGADFHRMHAANEMRGDGMAGLSFVAHAPDGHAYLSWTDLADLPGCRLKRVEELLIWVDAKITRPSLEQLEKDINDQLLNVIQPKDIAKRSQEAAKISVLMKEVLLRANSVIPEELFYQFAATVLIRDDENPKLIDEATHAAKVAMLRAAAQAGADFFMKAAPLRQSFGVWLTSEAALRELLISWTMATDRERMVRSALGFGSASKSTERTSTISPSG